MENRLQGMRMGTLVGRNARRRREVCFRDHVQGSTCALRSQFILGTTQVLNILDELVTVVTRAVEDYEAQSFEDNIFGIIPLLGCMWLCWQCPTTPLLQSL